MGNGSTPCARGLVTVAVLALLFIAGDDPVGDTAVRNIDLSCAMRIHQPATGLTGPVTQAEDNQRAKKGAKGDGLTRAAFSEH